MNTLKTPGEMTWRPFYSLFPGDQAEVVSALLPHLWIDTSKIRQQPTAADPLARKLRVGISYHVPNMQTLDTVAVSVDDAWSPRLLPEPLMAWLMIEHGELFRRKL